MTRAAVTSPRLPPWGLRLLADLGLWICVGGVMTVLGPFQTAERPLDERAAYWMCCMVGGGLIGIAIDEPLRRRVSRFWPRVIAASVLMTPPVTLLVGEINTVMYRAPVTLEELSGLWFQVLVVSFASMTFRQFAWAQSVPAPAVKVEAGGDPAAVFRRRLSAKKRAAAILAVEAEDHYLRVHTDAGEELITARFRDALEELAATPGFRIHRSWWVAADAIDQVRWLRGRGELRLTSGLTAPVSRSQAGKLKDAGWF